MIGLRARHAARRPVRPPRLTRAVARSRSRSAACSSWLGALVRRLAVRARPRSLIGGPSRCRPATARRSPTPTSRASRSSSISATPIAPTSARPTLAQISDVLRQPAGQAGQGAVHHRRSRARHAKLMADYVSSFDPRIIGLSGSPQAIAAVEKAYRVYARKAPTQGRRLCDGPFLGRLSDGREGRLRRGVQPASARPRKRRRN